MLKKSLTGLLLIKKQIQGAALTLVLVFSLFSFTMVGLSHGQPALSPALIQQLKSLPPARQKELARQYGVDLSMLQTGGVVEERYEVGQPGSRIEQVDPVIPIEQSRESVLLEYLEFVEQSRNVEDEEEKPLVKFGLDFFDDEITTMYEVDSIEVPESYRLGVGDQIELNVVGVEPIQAQLIIDRGGFVFIPKIGALSVSGMQFLEAKELIEAKISNQIIGAQAYVALSKLKNINIFLAGEVKRPGSYSVSGITTLTQALYMGGGVSEIGSLRNIQLKRNGITVTDFDLYDLLMRGDRANDAQLLSGDVIFVPVEKNNVVVTGAVARPAIYELREGETLDQLLGMAGGLETNAYTKQVTINRFEKSLSMQKVLNLDFEKESARKFPMLDGDTVTVKKSTDQVENPIVIEGAVVREGVFAWEEGARISTFLRDLDRDYLIEADLNVALLVRRVNQKLDIAVYPFSPINVSSNINSSDNILVQPFDRIVVLPLPDIEEDLIEIEEAVLDFSDDAENEVEEEEEEKTSSDERVELIKPIIEKLKTQAAFGRPPQIVTISGAVRLPGDYPLLGEGDIESLISLAGGAIDGAYLERAEVRRIEISEGVAKTKFVNLDLTKKNDSFSLMSRDLVRINLVPDWNPDENVEILGEVAFPGVYAISRGETLGSLLVRAGGLTERAYPEGLKYFSKVTKENQLSRARQLIRRFERERASREAVGQDRLAGGSDDAETSSFEKAILASFEGRLIVDAPRILAGDTNADVVLQDGDKIEVPLFLESIAVTGEIYEPGSFKFVEGRGINDYIDLAAGVTDRGQKKSIYVIEANGAVKKIPELRSRIFSFRKNSISEVLRPGATIVVPTDYDYEPPLDRYRGITSVVFESVTSLAALLSISNN